MSEWLGRAVSVVLVVVVAAIAVPWLLRSYIGVLLAAAILAPVVLAAWLISWLWDRLNP